MKLDFNLAEQVKQEIISVPGWNNPLSIRFGLYHWCNELYLIWQIIGVEHIFRIPLKIVNAQHSSNYAEHFILTLNKFREDLLEWKNLGFTEEWMLNYYNQFKSLIV